MKKLNLLPPEIQKQHEVDMAAILKKALAIIILAITVIIAGVGQYKLMALEKQVAILEAQRQQLLPLQQQKNKMELSLSINRDRIQAIDRISYARLPMAQLISDISSVIPKDIWLTNISANFSEEKELQKKYNVLLTGRAQEVASVGNFLYYLSNISYIDEVQVIYGEEKMINTAAVVEFQIRLTITPK